MISIKRAKIIHDRYPLPILLISLLFALKVFYLAFWVTPLWDVPDENGHFAYVQDLAEGRGMPLLGKAAINKDIMSHLRKTNVKSKVDNWIAQHPPVYYAIAAVPYKIGSYFTNDVEVLYRLPRIASVLSGALLLLVLFRSFRIVGLDTSRATAIAAAVGFIPMVSHMSSGINNDISLFLFCALATYYFARYLLQRNLRDAYFCALWMTIAGGTKMTAWVFLAPMVAILLLELPGPVKSWGKHAAGISILALSAPLAWMVRNIVHFGNPFYIAGSGSKVRFVEPVGRSFFEYLHLQPVFEHFMLNFYGLLGWCGTGSGQLAWFQVDRLPRDVFSILILCLACISVVYVLVLMYRALAQAAPQLPGNSLLSWVGCLIAKNQYSKVLIVLTFVVALLLAGYIGMTTYVTPSLFGGARVLAVTMLIFVGILALGLLLFISDPIDRIVLYGVFLLLFFGAILVYKVYGAYFWTGQMRATHGRYFYPVIPVLLLSFAITLKRLHVPAVIIAIFAVLMACMELEAFVLQAIPFYLDGGL